MSSEDKTPAHAEPVAWADYDAGLLNDFGGGDVGWWQDYLRAEIGRANDHWRMLTDYVDRLQDDITTLRARPAGVDLINRAEQEILHMPPAVNHLSPEHKIDRKAALAVISRIRAALTPNTAQEAPK